MIAIKINNICICNFLDNSDFKKVESYKNNDKNANDNNFNNNNIKKNHINIDNNKINNNESNQELESNRNSLKNILIENLFN